MSTKNVSPIIESVVKLLDQHANTIPLLSLLKYISYVVTESNFKILVQGDKVMICCKEIEVLQYLISLHKLK